MNTVAVQRSSRVQAGVSHRQFLALALPLVGSALAPPLLGAVDTALMGRMPDPAYIGSVAVGSLIFNTLYWLFGFLQMGTVGVAAPAQWGVGVALILALVHLAFREGIVAAFTQQPEVQEVALAHWGWMVFWPLVGFWGLLLNGVFVGATVTGPIRNALLAAFAVYLASLWLFVPLWRNHGMWLSFLLFTLMRSVVLGVYVPRLMAWSCGR